MLVEEFPGIDARDPHSIDSSPVGPHLYVKDVEVAAQKAIQAGLKVIRPIQVSLMVNDRVSLWTPSIPVDDAELHQKGEFKGNTEESHKALWSVTRRSGAGSTVSS